MKTKTALAELIEWIEEYTKKNKQTEPIWQKAKSLLPKEKLNLISAYKDGLHGTLMSDQYFNKNFEQ
jgi:hypothetical protein